MLKKKKQPELLRIDGRIENSTKESTQKTTCRKRFEEIRNALSAMKKCS